MAQPNGTEQMARQAANKRALTDAFIRSCPLSRAGRYDIVDAVAPGLILRVSVTRKTWLRRAAGKRLIIGVYPSVTLAEARQACAEMRDMDMAPLTVAEAVDRFVQAHARHLRSGHQVEWLLRKHVVPRIGSRSIASIGRSDIAALLREVQGPDTTKRARITNLVRAALSRMGRWTVSEGFTPANPAAMVEPRRGEKSRDRVLTDEELRAVWLACEDWFPFGAIVQLLILTGQRRDEVAGFTWAEVDQPARLWRLPARRMKGNRPHTLPLTGQIVQTFLLACRIDRLDRATPLLGSFSSWSKSKAKLDRISGVTGWRLNDLRRTAASGMVRLGAARDIVDQVLAHVVPGAGAVYIRESDLAGMRDALELWGAHVEKLIAPRLF